MTTNKAEKLKRPYNVKYQTRSITWPVPANVKTPWFKTAGDIPTTLEYFDGSMVDAMEATAKCLPDTTAYNFYGNKVSFQDFIAQVHAAAKALCAQGVRPGDRVTICMPNTPQAIILFYAVNRMGAVANMIHPLSGEEEIVHYINDDVTDGLAGVKKLLYPLTVKQKVSLPKNADILLWRDFISAGKRWKGAYIHHAASGDVAAILYSGGTTGTSKGILLSNLNFNALALQTGTAGDCLHPGHTMLSIMPVFHGFGLGVCIHTVLYWGGTAILIPQFDAKSYCKLLGQYKPNYIAGVPTLFEALLRMEDAQKLDMSQLEGIFSGGDSLTPELKNKVDLFLREHGSKEQVREGYGTTECVTASCLTPRFFFKSGSIGIPFPDTYYKIVIPSTHDEVPYGTVGEICLSGPTVMLGYMDNPRETAQTLQQHEDGQLWLHTGDLGVMDEEGFIYFKQRLKRMIVTSGYNVYPSQIENVLDAHPDVLMSTVIGVKDDYKMQRVKAFIVPKPGVQPSEELKRSILDYCSRRVAKYAIPREIEFRSELPHTLVGKVAYTVLEREESDKAAKAKTPAGVS